MQEDQEQSVVALIVNSPRGKIPPSGLTQEPTKNRPDPPRVVRGRESRGRSGVGRGGGGRGDIGRWGRKTPPPPQRRQDCQEASDSGDETEAKEAELNDEGERYGENSRGAPLEVVSVGGNFTPHGEKHGHPRLYPRT